MECCFARKTDRQRLRKESRFCLHLSCMPHIRSCEVTSDGCSIECSPALTIYANLFRTGVWECFRNICNGQGVHCLTMATRGF